MLALIQREVVDRRGWIDEEEFLNMIALAQAAPGIIAVNSAIFIGWRIGGWRGVAGAVLGAVLPSFVIILLIAMVFSEWKELPAVEAAFKGIRPAVVALIAAPLVKLARTAMKRPTPGPSIKGRELRNAAPLLISLAAALVIWLGHVNPVWVIIATIVITITTVWLITLKYKKPLRTSVAFGNALSARPANLPESKLSVARQSEPSPQSGNSRPKDINIKNNS